MATNYSNTSYPAYKRFSYRMQGPLDHMFYMCQNLLKKEVKHNRHFCDSMKCKQVALHSAV